MPDSLVDLLSKVLFEFGSVRVGVFGLVIAVGLVVAALTLSALLRWVIGAWMKRGGHGEAPGWISGLLRGVLLFVAVLLALRIFGVDLPEILASKLFTISDSPVTPMTLLAVVGVVLAAMVVSRIAQAALARSVKDSTHQARASVATVGRLVHYVVMFLGCAMALQTLGIDIAALLAVGGVLVVAFGFAMKNIAENFVSGVILLVERAIKVEDVLEVEGRQVRVVHIGIRTTIVRTRDGEELIVPNATMVGSTVTNYTYREPSYRIRLPLGVSYDSDLRQVIDVLDRAGQACPERKSGAPAEVRLLGFGDSTVDFELGVWVTDPWRSRRVQSRLYLAVWEAFREEGIVIAFPQMDVHFDPEVVAGLRRGGVLPEREPSPDAPPAGESRAA